MTGAVITIVIVLITVGGVTISVMSYHRLQRHRADAVAMASYRKLAEEAVLKQDALAARLGELTARLTAVEELLRSVE
jgi:hypothetical protein